MDKVQEATESKKKDCISKGWKLYRNKKGEEVKLRHVLEKISTWVKTIIKVVDVGVSADQSGHATLPWAIVKYLTMVWSMLQMAKAADDRVHRLDSRISMRSATL